MSFQVVIRILKKRKQDDIREPGANLNWGPRQKIQ